MGTLASDYAYETGERMARNLTITPEATAVLKALEAERDREDARLRRELLADMSECLIGRMFCG